MRIRHLPNLRRIATDTDQAQPINSGIAWQLYTYGLTCVQPGFDYFTSKFATDRILTNDLACFKASRLCHPGRVNDLCRCPRNEELSICESDVDHLVAELPRYIAAADGCPVDVDALEWWRRHKNDLPKWADMARRIALCQPSSAAAERVFSLLQCTFGDRQDLALEVYVEASLMLQYNKR